MIKSFDLKIYASADSIMFVEHKIILENIPKTGDLVMITIGKDFHS